MFENIFGNKFIKSYLSKALDQSSFPHALLFAGPDGVGKSLFAKELAACLLKSNSERIASETHPDFHPVRPEGKSGLHTIEAFRNLINEVHETPFEAPARVFVIYDAERMQPASANALLKTLEEPTPNTFLILLTSALQEILPTILSRCSVLRFQLLQEEEIAAILTAKGFSAHYAKLAHGSAGKAFELAQQPDIEKMVFPLFEKQKNYPEFLALLEKIIQTLEDEDPVKKSKKIDHFFASILMWHRDQIAKQLGLAQQRLFFPDASKNHGFVSDLHKVETAIEEARLGVLRNMKLSACFEKLFDWKL